MRRNGAEPSRRQRRSRLSPPPAPPAAPLEYRNPNANELKIRIGVNKSWNAIRQHPEIRARAPQNLSHRLRKFVLKEESYSEADVGLILQRLTSLGVLATDAHGLLIYHLEAMERMDRALKRLQERIKMDAPKPPKSLEALHNFFLSLPAAERLQNDGELFNAIQMAVWRGMLYVDLTLQVAYRPANWQAKGDAVQTVNIAFVLGWYRRPLYQLALTIQERMLASASIGLSEEALQAFCHQFMNSQAHAWTSEAKRLRGMEQLKFFLQKNGFLRWQQNRWWLVSERIQIWNQAVAQICHHLFAKPNHPETMEKLWNIFQRFRHQIPGFDGQSAMYLLCLCEKRGYIRIRNHQLEYPAVSYPHWEKPEDGQD